MIINALLGAALLFFGRKVFWLFVAGAGFMVGMDSSSRSLTLALALSISLHAVALSVHFKLPDIILASPNHISHFRQLDKGDVSQLALGKVGHSDPALVSLLPGPFVVFGILQIIR